MDFKKHGAEYVDEKFRPKRGYKEASRPLERVKSNHSLTSMNSLAHAT